MSTEIRKSHVDIVRSYCWYLLKISPLVGLLKPVCWSADAHLVGTQSPCVGHLLPVLRALSAQSLGRFLAISWVSCFYDTSCCFYDTLCCFYDTSMILLVKEREKYHFDNALSISCITYYFKSKMRLWYIFREKISFVCKLLPIYEPFVSVLASKSSARRSSGFAIRC